MASRVCWQQTIAGFDIKLMQRGRGRFSVTYGQQFNTDLNYGEAANELGQCIMHALACEGKLNSEV